MIQRTKHTEPSTNSYAAAYGYDYGGRLKATRKDWLRRTFVSCVSGGNTNNLFIPAENKIKI